MPRIHVLMDPAEREAFRAQAQREGRSLSDWLREAGRERLQRHQAKELRPGTQLLDFFADLDAQRHADRPDDDRPEEDWDEVKQRIAASRTPPTPS